MEGHLKLRVSLLKFEITLTVSLNLKLRYSLFKHLKLRYSLFKQLRLRKYIYWLDSNIVNNTIIICTVFKKKNPMQK